VRATRGPVCFSWRARRHCNVELRSLPLFGSDIVGKVNTGSSRLRPSQHDTLVHGCSTHWARQSNAGASPAPVQTPISVCIMTFPCITGPSLPLLVLSSIVMITVSQAMWVRLTVKKNPPSEVKRLCVPPVDRVTVRARALNTASSGTRDRGDEA
jgi:hypothetical protein